MGLENVALALCRYQQENQETVRPTFIGGTGGGKTTLAKDLAKQMDLPFLRILLATQLPEDLGGWPVGEKDRLSFKLMEELHLATKKPYFILFDELDKVRNDTLGTCLTVLYEKAIRNYQLHPQTVIACAMQHVNPSMWLADETGKAIAARLTFLPVPYRWNYIESKFAISLPHLHEREKGRKVELPVMEATPRTIECVLAFLRSSHGMKLNKEEKRMVLYGTLAKQDAEVIESTINKSLAWVDPVQTAKIDPIETIESLDVHSITQHIGPLIEVLSPKAWQQCLEKVWLKGTEEDAKSFLQNAYEHLKAKCEASPNKQCEVFGTAEADEIVKATNAAAETIAKEWQSIEAKKKKK